MGRPTCRIQFRNAMRRRWIGKLTVGELLGPAAKKPLVAATRPIPDAWVSEQQLWRVRGSFAAHEKEDTHIGQHTPFLECRAVFSSRAGSGNVTLNLDVDGFGRCPYNHPMGW